MKGVEEEREDISQKGAETRSMEELYLRYKRYAFSIAYRMLGSVADAEDAVQDCFAELQRKDRSQIHNIQAYLAKGVTNRCLNLMHSAHSQRETYIGEWLPEPITAAYDGPEAAAERKDTLSYAFLVLLERLTPNERAVFVLREVFQYEYEAIADMVNKSEANCRQIFSRAKRNLQPEASADCSGPVCESPVADSPAGGSSAASSSAEGSQTGSAEASLAARETLLRRFAAAFESYDVSGMLELLAEQPVLIADGGSGQVHTLLRPMAGRKGVLALLTSRRVLTRMREWETAFVTVNGEPGIVFTKDGAVTGVLCLKLGRTGDQIQELYLVLDPGKLQHIAT